MITYSTTILNYNIYLTYVVPYLIANATRLGLSSDQTDQLTAILAIWNTAIEKYLNPEKHGTLSVATINNLYATYNSITQAIKAQLKNNPVLSLTETDYLVIDIHKDEPRRRNVPVPTQEPVVGLTSARHLYNVYRVYDKANPAKRGKPKDVQRIKRKMLVKPLAATPPTLADMEQIEDVTVMSFDIPFTEPQVGEICYLAVCFSNDSGDSAYSEIIASPII